MGSTCRRPGCHREAAVTIGYDPVACQVWLDPLDPRSSSAQLLCLDHAERLHAPRGWVVVDRRDDQTLIVSPRAPTVDHAPPGRAPRRAPRRWGQLDEPRLEFTVDETAVTEPGVAEVLVEHLAVEPAVESAVVDPELVEPGPVEAGPIESVPARPAPIDDLTELLRPKGRLLSRAFEAGAAAPSSVLADDVAVSPPEDEATPTG